MASYNIANDRGQHARCGITPGKAIQAFRRGMNHIPSWLSDHSEFQLRCLLEYNYNSSIYAYFRM